ncbi:MAG TPA: methyltransferase domain-containing protein [Pyrinomonadaceae bacterium]|nr:methyltransferase domain-containing protein [Pyrinomonadaceae bacterium]
MESIETAVRQRYGAAAQEREAALCCPVEYDPQFLKIIPNEIIERDYGCGDPSRFVKAGETVLDLGSGSGKICYIAAQIVGRAGKIIGVDTNEEMLALAEKHRAAIGEKIGFQNVEFRYGKIQDLKLDLSLVNSYLRENPVKSASDFAEFNNFCERIKTERPLVADNSIDVVLSNCVLNLVRAEDKERLFKEMFRVVKRGGRVAISDIVSDEDVPAHLQKDAELWSGCISGAFREDSFLEAFDRAGFYGMEIVKRDEKPWRVVEGIEFRSVTVVAHKGKQGACLERNQAVIYKGPWKKVIDDDGHVLERGARTAVCDKTFQIYNREPYKNDIIAVEPVENISLEEAKEFDCRRTAKRSPRETKGLEYDLTDLSGTEGCAPGGNCC